MLELAYDRIAESITVQDIMERVLSVLPSSTVANVLALFENPLNERHKQVLIQDRMRCIGICYREDTSFADSAPSDLALDHCSPNDLRLSECIGQDLTIGEFMETLLASDFRWVAKHGVVLGWVDMYQLESYPARVCLFALLSDLDACLKDLLLTYMMAQNLKLELVDRTDGPEPYDQMVLDFLSVLPQDRREEVGRAMAQGRELLNSTNFRDKHRMLKRIWPRLYFNYGLALGGEDFFAKTKELRNRLAHGEPFLELFDDGPSSVSVSDYVSRVRAMRHRVLHYSEKLRSVIDLLVASDNPLTLRSLQDALCAVAFPTE